MTKAIAPNRIKKEEDKFLLREFERCAKFIGEY